MIFSSNFLKRWCFQNRPRRDMIFLVLSGKMVFFSRKHIFSLGRKWEMTFLRKYMEIWYVISYDMIWYDMIWNIIWYITKVAPRPSVKNNQRRSYPTKIYLKVIKVLDWQPKMSSSNSLSFHEVLYRRFHAPLPSEKKQQT